MFKVAFDDDVVGALPPAVVALAEADALCAAARLVDLLCPFVYPFVCIVCVDEMKAIENKYCLSLK